MLPKVCGSTRVLFHRHSRPAPCMRMKTCTRCGLAQALDQFPPRRRGRPRLQTWCRACFAENNARYYQEHLVAQKTRLLRNTATRRRENQQQIITYLRDHPCVDCGEEDIVVLEFDHLREKIADVSTYSSGGRSWERVKTEIDKCEVRCTNCHRLKTAKRWVISRLPRDGSPAPREIARLPIQLLIGSLLATRNCRVCGRRKPLVEFPLRSLEKQTRQWICLRCQRTYTNGWYARNRKKQIANVRHRKDRHRREIAALLHEYLLAHPCVDCGARDPRVLEFDHIRDKSDEISRMALQGRAWSAVAEEIAKCEVRCANCHRRKTAVERGWYRAVRHV